MALTATTDRNPEITLTAAEQTIALEFQFIDAEHVMVWADGVLLQLGTHYEITGGDGATGSCTFKAAGPGAGAVVNARRMVPYDQPLSLPAGYYNDNIEGALDRTEMQVQQLAADLASVMSAAESGDWDGVEYAIPLIPPDSVTGDKLVDGSVTADKLGASAVETSKIAANAVTAAKLNSDVFGTNSGQALPGNHASVTNTRDPNNHSHSDNKLAQANTHESPDTDSATTALHHTLGTGANQACAGNDARLSDTRTPSASSITAAMLSTDALRVMPGAVMPYALLTPPPGWLECNGAAVSRTAYADLFAAVVPSQGAVTVSIASPGVFSKTAHGLIAGSPVYFTTTGALPTGLSANTIYYVISAGLTADAFQVSSTLNGSAVNTSGSQSGTHTLYRCPFGLGDGSTTFTLPDLRGEFVRGWDHSKGTDAGRVFGSSQTDAFQGHRHEINAYGNTAGSSSVTKLGGTNSNVSGLVKDPEADSTNGTPRTASETRPRNIALMYCIKY